MQLTGRGERSGMNAHTLEPEGWDLRPHTSPHYGPAELNSRGNGGHYP
jgi:hypothetical protein